MEWLKTLFGTTDDGQAEALTYEQLSQKIAAQGDKLQIVNLKDGGYVAKEKLDAKITELKGVQQQLTDANTTIQSYKDMDIDGIKKSVDDWKEKYDTDTKALEKKLADQEYSHQKDMYFAGVNFKSKGAKAGIMAEFDKQQFQLKDGTFLGADAWLEQQKKDDPESFISETPDNENDQGNGDNGGQSTQQQNLPSFATSTSSGSGQSDGQSDQKSIFGFGFTGVRKHE